MTSAADIRRHFEIAATLLASKADGHKFSKAMVGVRSSHIVGRKEGEEFRVYLYPGFAYPGYKEVVFWFYPNGDDVVLGKSRIKIKIDYETGMEISEPAIDCDDMIERFQAYTKLNKVL